MMNRIAFSWFFLASILCIILCYSLPASSEEGSPLALMIVMDSSGSMKKTDPKNLRMEAGMSLIEMAGIGDKIGIVAFSDEGELLSPLVEIEGAEEKKRLAEAIFRVGSQGRFTNINTGVEIALNELKAYKGEAQRSIILLTDGEFDPPPEAGRKEELIERLRRVILPEYKSQGISIYAVGFAKADDELMKGLAEETRGEYIRVSEPEGLRGVFRLIYRGLRPVRIPYMEKEKPAKITPPQPEIAREELKPLLKEELQPMTSENLKSLVKPYFNLLMGGAGVILILALIGLPLLVGQSRKMGTVTKKFTQFEEEFKGEIAKLRERMEGGERPEGTGELEGNISTLNKVITGMERDVEEKTQLVSERDKEIEEPKEALRGQEESITLQATEDHRIGLFNSLSPILIQLPSVKRAIEEGAQIGVKDVIGLLSVVEGTLGNMGFIPIGKPGEIAVFDPRYHQLASGALERQIKEGEKVEVKFVGYRYNDKVLKKAHVVRIDDK